MHACILHVLSVRLTKEAIENVLAVSTNMSSQHSCEQDDLSNNFSNLKDLFTFAQTCFCVYIATSKKCSPTLTEQNEERCSSRLVPYIGL